MNTSDNIRDNLACWSDGGDAELAESHVHFVVEEGGKGVAYEWREEEQRDDRVVYVVVDLKLVCISSDSLDEYD